MTTRGESVRTLQERKRLGQFFTGARLARLLVELAGPNRFDSVVDPMAGSGDMLCAAADAGLNGHLAAIEIDPQAASAATGRLEKRSIDHEVVCGNAFDARTIAGLRQSAWDVVITNPPYVRYQTGAKAGAAIDAPDAAEVRAGLCSVLGWLESAGNTWAGRLQDAASSYSGLADLAVPSWILCAALTRPGGTLAMVVPDTWLSRDYAAPIRDLLDTEFDVRVVVRDEDAVWFDDALVRTTLVVAGRLPGRPRRRTSAYPIVSVARESGTGTSVVGKAFPADPLPERAFAAWATALKGSTSCLPVGLGVRWVASRTAGREVAALPDDMIGLLGSAYEPGRIMTLEAVGWRVGQGLRTGANEFFYLTEVSRTRGSVLARTSSVFGGQQIEIPSSLVRPALRRQSEVRSSVTARAAGSLVLALDGHALPEDVAACVRAGLSRSATPKVLPEPVAAFVRLAEKTNVGTADAPRFIPELSAVRTNARPIEKLGAGLAPRFWYQLPPLAARHTPDVLLPRINAFLPCPRINPQRALIVDANFNALWGDGGHSADAHAMLAFLSSSWSSAFLESQATVLGGGALKVEATLLRRIPVPILDAAALARLTLLGRELATADGCEPDVQAEIDAAVVAAAVDGDAERVGRALRDKASEAAACRSR